MNKLIRCSKKDAIELLKFARDDDIEHKQPIDENVIKMLKLLGVKNG